MGAKIKENHSLYFIDLRFVVQTHLVSRKESIDEERAQQHSCFVGEFSVHGKNHNDKMSA